MAKLMVLGLKGETGLWFVDFEAGTVSAMEGDRTDYISAEAVGDSGSVDIAVPFEMKGAAFSGHYYGTPATDAARPAH